MKKSDGLNIMVLSISLIWLRIWVQFLIGRFILEDNFSIRLGPLRWVLTSHCAGSRGLNLLTAVRPVELAHCGIKVVSILPVRWEKNPPVVWTFVVLFDIGLKQYWEAQSLYRWLETHATSLCFDTISGIVFVMVMVFKQLWALLLTWINCNPIMDK